MKRLKRLVSIASSETPIWIIAMWQWQPNDRFGHIEKWTYVAMFFGAIVFLSMLSTDIAIELGYVKPWPEQ